MSWVCCQIETKYRWRYRLRESERVNLVAWTWKLQKHTRGKYLFERTFRGWKEENRYRCWNDNESKDHTFRWANFWAWLIYSGEDCSVVEVVFKIRKNSNCYYSLAKFISILSFWSISSNGWWPYSILRIRFRIHLILQRKWYDLSIEL